MKKMLMMMAVAVLAIGVQAGAVQWNVSGLRTPAAITGLNSGAVLAGAVAYIFENSSAPTVASVKAALEGKTYSTAASLKSGTSSAAGVVAGANFGSYVGVPASMYVVIFDTGVKSANGETGNFMISSVVTKTFAATGNQTYSFAFNSTASTWTGYTVVPEPTSMALLALGVAALGLRRKFRK